MELFDSFPVSTLLEILGCNRTIVITAVVDLSVSTLLEILVSVRGGGGVRVPGTRFQPFLRFWLGEARNSTPPHLDVSTLLEILDRMVLRSHPLCDMLFGFQPFLRFWCEA